MVYRSKLGRAGESRQSDLQELDTCIFSPAIPIVPTENIFTRIYLQGDAIGTIQNESDTMEDV